MVSREKERGVHWLETSPDEKREGEYLKTSMKSSLYSKVKKIGVAVAKVTYTLL